MAPAMYRLIYMTTLSILIKTMMILKNRLVTVVMVTLTVSLPAGDTLI